MQSVLLVAPASEPVSLAEAKAWLRLDSDTEDTIVTALIAAARQSIELITRRALVTQTWRLILDAWDSTICKTSFGSGACVSMPTVAIPLAPVASLVALRIYDAAGVPQVIGSSTYRLAGGADDARIVFTNTPPAPGRAADGIEIDVVIGYGSATQVPQPLRQALLMLVARLYENRGDAEAASPQHLRGAAAALVAPYRRARLA